MASTEPDFVSLVDIFAPALRRLQHVSGISSEALLRGVATSLGVELARAMTSTSFSSVVEELRVLFNSLRLGRVDVEPTSSGATLSVSECLGCEQIPDAMVATNCTLREGILRTIFEERLGVDTRVRLLESRGTEFGAKRCVFSVNFGKDLR